MRDTISHKRKHLMSPLFFSYTAKKNEEEIEFWPFGTLIIGCHLSFSFFTSFLCVFSSKVLRRRIRLAHFFSKKKKMLVDLLSESNQHGTKREKAAHHLNRKNKIIKRRRNLKRVIRYYGSTHLRFYFLLFYVRPRFFCSIYGDVDMKLFASPVQPVFF